MRGLTRECILVLCLAGVEGVGCRGAANRADPPRSGGACPLKTNEAWRAFVSLHANDHRWAKTCERDCDLAFDHSVSGIAKTFEDCAEFLADHPDIEQCTRNFRRFVPAWLSLHAPASYGFRSENRAYHLAQETAEQPAGMMTPPPALVAAFPQRRDIEAAARANGWKYVTHASAITGTRTILYLPDPDGRFDQWIVVNYEFHPDHVEETSPLAFLAVQKRAAAAAPPYPRVRLHFRDYTATRGEDGYHLALDPSFNGKCFACHPSGVRRLIAYPTPFTGARPVHGEVGFDERAEAAEPPGFAAQRLDEFNAILGSYGLPDWQGQVDPADFGPPLGARQGCTKCHDGATRGNLTIITSSPQIDAKISGQLAMPPAPGMRELMAKRLMAPETLTDADRADVERAEAEHQAIQETFHEDRLPALVDWLLEKDGGCRLW